MTAVVQLLNAGDAEGALASARAAFELGRRLGDADVQALSLTVQGYALVRLGRLAEGVACLDEAMAGAVGGQLGPLATGFAYCWTLSTCLDLLDYRRAAEWTEAIQQSAGRARPAGYPGDCRLHRATVLVVRGIWEEGEREARTARAECATCDQRHAGMAAYEIGEVRRRIGDLVGAEEAFREAHELGTLPQPGLALLYLARGDGAAAAAAIKGARAQVAWDRLAVAKLLPAEVEITLAAGDHETARGGSHAGRDRRHLRHDGAQGRCVRRARCAAARQRRCHGCGREPAAGGAALARGRGTVRRGAGQNTPRRGAARARRPRGERDGAPRGGFGLRAAGRPARRCPRR